MPGAGRSPRRRQPDRGRGKIMLETIWFMLWGVLWAVYFMLDGFDLGLGTLLPFSGQERDRPAPYLSGHGAVLGRQRSLADHRWRRDVCGLPRHLRRDVQRPLFALDAYPVRPDHPGRLHCLPGGSGQPPVEAPFGTGVWSWAASCPPCCSGSPSPTSFGASPSTPRESTRATC